MYCPWKKEEKKSSGVLKGVLIAVGAIAAVAAALAVFYTLFKKYFKITFECGDCDSCDTSCDSCDELEPECCYADNDELSAEDVDTEDSAE